MIYNSMSCKHKKTPPGRVFYILSITPGGIFVLKPKEGLTQLSESEFNSAKYSYSRHCIIQIRFIFLI